VSVACPCCGFLTLHARADDDVVPGGPNSALSLTQARANFAEIGACEPRVLPHVRAPAVEELP
jgi:hypothetical protein